jgi:hypothetical protein
MGALFSPTSLCERGSNLVPILVRVTAAVFGLLLLPALPAISFADAEGGAKKTSAPAQSVECPKCHHLNRPNAKFCADCGTVLRKGGCPRCGATLVPGEKFCTECGLEVSAGGLVPPKEPTPPAEPGARSEPEVSYPTFKLGGFHDIVFNGDSKSSPRGFSLGQLVLHTNSLLSPSVQFFSELSFTPRSDAGTGTPAAPGYNADVERAIIRFDQSDLLRFSAGRYHTPINWWNTAYHHGLWLQTSIARPEMARFGGQFIPVHFVGGLVEGSTPAKGLNLNYKVGVGNGRGPAASRANDFGDNNNSLAGLVNLYVRPESIYGLQIGGAYYRDKISLTGGKQYHEDIMSAHVVLETETPEIIAEYSRVNHKEIGGPSASSQAFYVQVAYRLPSAGKRLKPYVRVERIWVPKGEPVLTATPSLKGILGGIRYDFTDFAAIKFEYRDFRRSTSPNATGFFSQLSYIF